MPLLPNILLPIGESTGVFFSCSSNFSLVIKSSLIGLCLSSKTTSKITNETSKTARRLTRIIFPEKQNKIINVLHFLLLLLKLSKFFLNQ